jgi:hypothetical protein
MVADDAGRLRESAGTNHPYREILVVDHRAKDFWKKLHVGCEF